MVYRPYFFRDQQSCSAAVIEHTEELSDATATGSIIIIIIFLHGLGCLTCSGIDALSSFPRASTISSSLRFVVESMFQESGVVHSFKVFDPVLFVFGSHVFYSRDL